jgi:group I intron endonuclease
MYIYKTTNLITNKIYVGQTMFDNKNYLGSGVHIKHSIKKYGKKNFKKEILEYCEREKLNEREIFWISALNATNAEIGYNLNKGGSYTTDDNVKKKFKRLHKKSLKFLKTIGNKLNEKRKRMEGTL